MYKTIFFLIYLLFAGTAGATTFLKDFDGKIHTLDEYTSQGKWTVVMFWASDCHVCNKEVHQYIEFHSQRKNRNAQVIGVSMDGPEKLKEAKSFKTRHNVNFPNLIGSPESVAKLYYDLTGSQFTGTPSFLVFSPEGELLAQQAGAVPAKLLDEFIEKSITK